MVWRIALVGGDEFRPGCEEMDRAILDSTGLERPSLLVIPTAAAQEKPEKAASNGVSYFSALGADASPLMGTGRGARQRRGAAVSRRRRGRALPHGG